jgi:hypothetical protein
MYKILVNYTVLLVLSLGCEPMGQKEGKTEIKPLVYNSKVPVLRNEKRITYDIGNSKGVVVVHVGDKVSKRFLIYNQNGDLWATFAFEGSLKSSLSKIKPFAKDVDTYLLALNCIEITDKYYKVIVNENNKEAKYIRIQDRSFQLKTWPKYILTCFSVAFDPKDNPIKTTASDKAKELTYNKDEFYHPVKFQGDWIQVKWGDETNWHYGWVKWRRNKTLILELFNNA